MSIHEHKGIYLFHVISVFIWCIHNHLAEMMAAYWFRSVFYLGLFVDIIIKTNSPSRLLKRFQANFTTVRPHNSAVLQKTCIIRCIHQINVRYSLVGSSVLRSQPQKYVYSVLYHFATVSQPLYKNCFCCISSHCKSCQMFLVKRQ